MVIKKFIAKSLPEALTKVKKDFGEDAVILKTRFSNSSNPLKKDQKLVEVTAAIDNNAVKPVRIPSTQTQVVEKTAIPQPIKNRLTEEKTPPRIIEAEKQTPIKSGSVMEPRPLPSEILGEIRSEILQMKKDLHEKLERADAPREESGLSDDALDGIKNEIHELRSSLANRAERSLFGEPLGSQLDYARGLVEKHLPEHIALEIIKNIPVENLRSNDRQAGWTQIVKNITGMLNTGEPIKLAESGPTVIMLVGPTGGGKTSAAARLAFHFSLENDCSVSLITTDKFRADSHEQLMSLANVIGCSFSAISTPQEMAVLMKTFKEGVVLIDTSGITNQKEIGELTAMIGAANPHEVHLVVPADISSGDLNAFFENHSDLSLDRLLVTKLDQSAYRGGIIGSAIQRGLRFSYQSSSRELPGMFESFNPGVFTASLMPVERSKTLEKITA